jgi:DNA ligase (NAD+)
MNKAEAKKEIKKLRDEINHHNYKYYVKNNPVISDYEFDQLLKKLESLEEKYPDLVTLDSPTQRVGGEPLDGFTTVEHKIAMLSLANTYNLFVVQHEAMEYKEMISPPISKPSIVFLYG